MTEVIRFQTNVPEHLALKFDEGKLVEGRFGDQVYYSLADGRAMYVHPTVAAKIAELEIRQGQPFVICKRQIRRPGERKASIDWVVERVEASGLPEQQLEATLRNSIAAVNGKKNGAAGLQQPVVRPAAAVSAVQDNAQDNNGNGSTNGSAATNGHASLGPGVNELAPAVIERPKTRLEDALKTVVDAVAKATEYAKQVGYQMPPFSSEDIRTMANTLMIQSGNGGASWPR